ncbi:MAG: class I SAM-dependent methyltransferase [Chromatiaceae bacterium]|nr:class I SAM-dependent methyltransferase [Chromatiaceae bacterium]
MNDVATQKDKATEFVADLYRILLEREPDKEGLTNRVSSLLTKKVSPVEIVRTLLNSREAEARTFNKVWAKRTSTYRLDLNFDPEIANQLFEKTAAFWREAGFDRNEVYFSVLSSTRWKGQPPEGEIINFYKSGKSFIDFCCARLRENGINNFGDMICTDFGSGIGRLAFSASNIFKRVHAIDFSRGHLDLLQDNMRRYPSLHNGNIDCFYLDSLASIDEAPSGVDFIYSYITLQHNTPFVIAVMLRGLLKALKAGGYACLHIPIHHPFYRFSHEEYLSSSRSGARMEMHILPRENIREVAGQVGAKIVDSYGYGGTKGVYSEMFLFKKEA